MPDDDVKPIASAIQPYSSRSTVPEGTIRAFTYADFHEYVSKWGSGKLDDTLVVVGNAGIGKSEAALASLRGVAHLYLKGQASPYGVYLKLAEHVNQPIVLDDLDNLVSDKQVTGLLKSLLETNSPHVVQWTNAKTMAENAKIGSQIETTSRVMLLANEISVVSRNFAAVMDRCTFVYFLPTPDEIVKYVRSWFDLKRHSDVFEYVSERLHLTPSASCRYYVHGVKWKRADLDWRNMVNDLMRPSNSKALLVKEILADASLKTAKAREAFWTEKTGETPQAFRAHKKAVELASGIVNKANEARSEGLRKKYATGWKPKRKKA
jgi:hypothetical protein